MVPVGLLIVLSVPCHVKKVIFAVKSHIENQKVQDKFLPWFVNLAILSYYCADKAFGLVEKHHVFGVLVELQNRCFSFLASCHPIEFYEHAIVKFLPEY